MTYVTGIDRGCAARLGVIVLNNGRGGNETITFSDLISRRIWTLSVYRHMNSSKIWAKRERKLNLTLE